MHGEKSQDVRLGVMKLDIYLFRRIMAYIGRYGKGVKKSISKIRRSCKTFCRLVSQPCNMAIKDGKIKSELWRYSLQRNYYGLKDSFTIKINLIPMVFMIEYPSRE